MAPAPNRTQIPLSRPRQVGDDRHQASGGPGRGYEKATCALFEFKSNPIPTDDTNRTWRDLW